MKNIKIDPQLELGFGAAGIAPRYPRRGASSTRRQRLGRWWFNRMRELVDSAMDWPAPPLPRPEQPVFALARRELDLAALRHES